MSMLALLAATGGGQPKLFVDDCFSSFTYTGNGSTQTITNGIDLAGKGGTVHIKLRSGVANHKVCSTSGYAYSFGLAQQTNQLDRSMDGNLDTFNSNGFHLTGTDGAYNSNGSTYVAWSFRDAAKFHKQLTVTKSAGSNAAVDLSSLGTVGMVKVQRIDTTGSWYVWHRSLTAGKLLIGETTAAEATLGHITMSGTTLTLVNGVIADGTYHVEAYAHDTGVDGLIQCGSFTTDGAAQGQVVNLGWEPQFLSTKEVGGIDNWYLMDSSRGMPANPGTSPYLIQNTSAAESSVAGGFIIRPSALGFQAQESASKTYIYLAIRRPNKPPTLGTQVYNAIARTGTGAAATVTGVGFAPDLVMSGNRGSWRASLFDRLRGDTQQLQITSGATETAYTTSLTTFNMDGFSAGADGSSGNVNLAATSYIHHCLSRRIGVFDTVCDTGTGTAHTINHNLGVIPELMLRKTRSGTLGWGVYCAALGNTKQLEMTTATASVVATTAWNSTTPTASVFTVGTGTNVNTNAATYVTHLFATLAGISKVFSYTGNGASQTIACGFAAGARFILIKRESADGSWYLWDSVRGIVAGNDTYFNVDVLQAEITTDDSIDPDSSGFIVNQVAATNINVTSATYIGLAIA